MNNKLISFLIFLLFCCKWFFFLSWWLHDFFKYQSVFVVVVVGFFLWVRNHTSTYLSIFNFYILKPLLFKDLKAILKTYSSSEKKAGLENKELNMTRNVLPGYYWFKNILLPLCFIYWDWCLYITFDNYTPNWHFSGQIQSVSDVTHRRQGRLLQCSISICT